MENTPPFVPPINGEIRLTYTVSITTTPEHQKAIERAIDTRLQALGELAVDGQAEVCKTTLHNSPQYQELQDFKRRREAAEQLLDEAGLTPRERQIATLIKLGKSNQDMADYLGRSLTTIKTLASRVYKKTGIHDRDELAARLNGMTKEEWYDPLGLYAQDQHTN